jgi:hypothetical protein
MVTSSVMLLSTSITAALILASGIEVHSGSDCPSREAIVAKLGLLSSEEAQDGVASVEVAALGTDGTTEVRLRLLRPDASVVGDRRLVLRGSCDEMADTVATVLAAWRAPPLASAAPPQTAASPVVPAPPARTALQAWLGVGGGVAWLGGTAATGNLELVAASPTSHARARLAAFAQTSRRLDLADGNVSWRRTHAELGLGWQSRGATHGSYWQASTDASLLLGWLQASGHGYYQNQRPDAFEYGMGAGLRGERRLGAWALWLEGRTTLWARPQRVVLQESPRNALLPRLDVLVIVGASHLLIR